VAEAAGRRGVGGVGGSVWGGGVCVVVLCVVAFLVCSSVMSRCSAMGKLSR
jgi:hypothetical protein